MSAAQRVVVVRHGETAWSEERRHTGRTDIPLSEAGRARATALGPMLAQLPGVGSAHVLTSPLQRARETARLAGFGHAEVDDGLAEWDYGEAEGRRTVDIREETPGWSVWTSEIAGGEQLADVARRADGVLARLPAGLSVVFAHAHMLRILAARWCGLDPTLGRVLVIDPGGVGVLGRDREHRVVERWNLTPDLLAGLMERTATISEMSAGGAPSTP